MQEDDEGYLWMSTNLGIVRFNPEARSFTSYTIKNGLKTNQFNYKSSFKTDDGTLYFGSVDGFVRFQPANLKRTGITSPLVFTDLQLNNYPANVTDDNSPLRESIQYSDEIRLPHNKNSIALQFAVLNYSGRNANNVIYKLEGTDKEWRPSSANNYISYSNLAPGKYRLTLAYEMEEGNPNGTIEKTLDIYVKHPLWMTWWALLIYISVIGLAIFLVNKKSLRDQKRKMNIFRQEKERELYKSKIDFFTNVAHEIRTPLSLIKAPLGQVLQSKSLSKEVMENLVIMDKNTDRLLNLTTQLLDFHKTESDLYSLDLRTYNVTRLVEETYLRFQPYARQHRVSMNLELPETDLFAQIDKEAFVKIVSNLISNAIKYGETFVRITLRETNRDESAPLLELVTENDGTLIPQDYRTEIFQTFVHLDRNANKIINGTGIGLALAKSLTELLKGKLIYSVENQHNVFRLSLPVGAVKEEEATESEQAVVEIRKEKENELKQELPTALLVEDDHEMIDFLSKCLTENYLVLCAANGNEALELLKNNSVNIIVSDVMMPEMDGFELTRQVKSNIEFSHIPVVLLTAKANIRSKVEGLELGADAYIEKPFSMDILEAQMDNLLQNRVRLRDTFIKHPYLSSDTSGLSKSDLDFMSKLSAVVRDNLSNSEFNVEDIANQFNMSRASFYRKIKGILDLTPNEYIRLERLKKASVLLKENNYKVNEICYMVGFNSPSYFSKCFQQEYGVSPKEFI